MPGSSTEELLDGFDHVETRPEFEARIREGRPLTVQLGLDPTSADLHIGHAVVLHKLQQFVDAGEQAGKVLDMERIKLDYNSRWLAPLSMADLLRLLARVTVAQMLEREDFRARYGGGTPISLHEFLYPVAQAYDSVALEAGVELGGNDQLFNLLMGRHYQRESGQREQICMTVPLLEGLDGVEKMSKSKGNYVGLTEPAEQQFGKLMRITDEMIPRYARLGAFRSLPEVERLAQGLIGGALHPMEEKKRLAQDIVARYHGSAAAKTAREYFERTVQRRELPSDVREMPAGGARRVTDVIVAAGFAESKRAAERLISGNGVKVDGILVSDPRAPWTAVQSATLSVGSRKFVKVLPSER